MYVAFLLLSTLLATPPTDGAAAGPFVNTVGMMMVPVPSGSFRMGSPADERGRRMNEGPHRSVRITRGFFMAAHEVTTGQFRTFVERTGYRTEAERDPSGGFGIDFTTAQVRQDDTVTWRSPGFPGFTPGEEHPVVLVSWQDAEAFCRWLSETEGRTYRLPTEAEWEHAARGGTTTPYSCGTAPSSLAGSANVADAALRARVPACGHAEAWDDGHPFTAPVGSFAPNAFGLHDMHGNAWEWCSDWYAFDAYLSGPVDDPTGPPSGASAPSAAAAGSIPRRATARPSARTSTHGSATAC